MQARSSEPPSLPPEYLEHPDLDAKAVEKKFYSGLSRLNDYESGLYFFYHPESGRRAESNRSIRSRFCQETREHKLSKIVVNVIVDREIHYHDALRQKLKRCAPGKIPPELTYQVLEDEDYLVRLDMLGCLSDDQKKQIEKKYPSLAKRFIHETVQPIAPIVEKPQPEKAVSRVPAIEPAREKVIVKPITTGGPTSVPVKVVPPIVTEPVRPVVEVSPIVPKKVPEKAWGKESWEYPPSYLDLIEAQTQEWEKFTPKVHKVLSGLTATSMNRVANLGNLMGRVFEALDFREPLTRLLRNPRFQRSVAMLLLGFGAFGFKDRPEGRSIFSAVTDRLNSIPPTVAAISNEMQATLTQAQTDFVQFTSPIGTAIATTWETNVPIIISRIQEISGGGPAISFIQSVPIIPTPQAAAAAPVEMPVESLPKTASEKTNIVTEAERLDIFRKADYPEPPPDLKQVTVRPESDYDNYVIPGYKSKTDSPYLKGLDYGRFPWAGVGDIWEPEDLDKIPADANAKNVRMVITSENDLPRVAAVVRAAKARGINVAVQHSTPELPADKAHFRQVVRGILMNNPPAYYQFMNEMGWLDDKGIPDQYYAGSHESIYQDYPAYVKIIQEEIRANGNKTKLVLGSFGWPFLASNAKMDNLFKGLISAGVDVNDIYVDLHLYDHLEGEWSQNVTIARVKKLAQLNGVSPKYVAYEMYIGSDAPQTPQYIARGFDYYKNTYGFDLVIAYPVTGSWAK